MSIRQFLVELTIRYYALFERNSRFCQSTTMCRPTPHFAADYDCANCRDRNRNRQANWGDKLIATL